jgi:hypothetical protein
MGQALAELPRRVGRRPYRQDEGPPLEALLVPEGARRTMEEIGTPIPVARRSANSSARRCSPPFVACRHGLLITISGLPGSGTTVLSPSPTLSVSCARAAGPSPDGGGGMPCRVRRTPRTTRRSTGARRPPEVRAAGAAEVLAPAGGWRRAGCRPCGCGWTVPTRRAARGLSEGPHGAGPAGQRRAQRPRIGCYWKVRRRPRRLPTTT